MKNKSLANQNFIRYNNQLKVLDIMKLGSHSCTDIAKKAGLSNTAAENIVDELIGMNILVQSHRTETGRPGRRPIKYHLNGELGVVASVDLTDRDLLVCISNMNRQILFRDTVKNVIIITESVFREIFAVIRKGLATPTVGRKKLLAVCVASPGIISPETGRYILAPRIENYEKVNLSELFAKEFDCDVIVKKDIAAGLVGEMQFGALSDLRPKNAVFVHFDVNIGLAFLLEGKIHEGDHGFAGELGFYAPDVNAPMRGAGEYFSITAMYIDIIERLKKEGADHPLAGKAVLDFDEVKLLFLSGDELVSSVVKKNAENLAVQLLNIAYLLDVENVVIDGRIVELGDKFLEYVDSYISRYRRTKTRINVQYTTLMNRAITLGCISSAVDAEYDKLLRARQE